MASYSHYSLGAHIIKHRHKVTSTSVGTVGFDLSQEDLEASYTDYDIAYVIAGYEHRPDLISNVFYYTPAYWWLLLLYNNIDDPFEGLNVGDQIKIPRII